MNQVCIKQIIQWIVAFTFSIFIMNAIVAGYEVSPAFLKRDGGATRGVWMPESFLVKGNEGRAISNVDANGYINENDNLIDSGYVLFMGNSQSDGIQVSTNRRYISLINAELQSINNDDMVYAYNVSASGYDFCDIVSGFTAAMQEFPNSAAIVLQIGGVSWTLEKLQQCIRQRTFSEEMRGGYMANHLTNRQRLEQVVKMGFPFLIYLKEERVEKVQLNFDGAFWYSMDKNKSAEEDVDDSLVWSTYEVVLDNVLGFLRSNYKDKLIILELPNISVVGGGILENSDGVRQELFARLCEKNDIIYVNMYDTYAREYKEKLVLPYGFSNTKPGYGHLNEAGHQMVADVLYPLLKGGIEQ